jgi:hypothetical protein
MTLDTYGTSFEGMHEATALALGEAAGQPSGTPTDPGQRATEFRAVEGGAETMSGGTLLVEAYAALWIILFGFLLVSWRRQGRIDARVAELERAVSRGSAK